MADSLLQTAGNWTAGHLYNAANKVVRDATAAHNEQLALRSRIAALFRQAEAMPQGYGRDKALTAARGLSRKLARQLIDYRNFVGKWKGTMERVSSWLRSLGLTPPTLELEGLGALPLVPLALAAAVAVAGAYVVSMVVTNGAMSRAVGNEEKFYSDFMDGQLTWQQYEQASKNNLAALEAAAAAAKKGTPTGLVESLTPLALIVAAIVLLPPLIRALPQGVRR